MIFLINRQLIRRMINKSITNQKVNMSHHSKLKSLKVPAFKVDSKNVFIIKEPSEFHEKLLELIGLSNKRIILSTLYVGTSDLEKNLVNKLNDQLKSKSELKTTILLDFNRGNREDANGESSKTLLRPLLDHNSITDSLSNQNNRPNDQNEDTNKVTKFNLNKDAVSNRISINFFLSPDFSNIFLKKTLLNRQKYNEIISLQHIKIYLFDDDLIISGANLNEQYFTNRQDRYIYVRNCRHLADYLEQLINSIGRISMHLNQDGTFDCELDPLEEKNKQEIQFRLRDDVEKLNRKYFVKFDNPKYQKKDKTETETMIYPLLQMKKFQVNTDETFTKFIFNNLTSTSKLYLASGYFNLTKDYQQCIFKTASKEPKSFVELIMASEKVNSFYKAKGPIQHIPAVYTQLSKIFLEDLNSKMLDNVNLLSYFKSNWTFHSKGLWLHDPSSDYFLSLIGSPNFGYRSVYKDLELQFAILTKDDNLICKFLDEYENIKKYSTLVDSPDQLPFVRYWVRIATKFVKNFF